MRAWGRVGVSLDDYCDRGAYCGPCEDRGRLRVRVRVGVRARARVGVGVMVRVRVRVGGVRVRVSVRPAKMARERRDGMSDSWG